MLNILRNIRDRIINNTNISGLWNQQTQPPHENQHTQLENPDFQYINEYIINSLNDITNKKMLKEIDDELLEYRMLDNYIFNKYVLFIERKLNITKENAIIFVNNNYIYIHHIVNYELFTSEIKKNMEQEKIKKTIDFQNYIINFKI